MPVDDDFWDRRGYEYRMHRLFVAIRPPAFIRQLLLTAMGGVLSLIHI